MPKRMIFVRGSRRLSSSTRPTDLEDPNESRSTRSLLVLAISRELERRELKIVRDQVGSPTCADDIATAPTEVLTCMQRRGRGLWALSEFGGTYHMTAAGETTWYDFAKAILEEAAALSGNPPWLATATSGRGLIAEHVLPISSVEFQSPAARPGYAVLSNRRLREAFAIALPDWRNQLRCCVVSEHVAANPLPS